MYVCSLCACRAWGSQKRALGPLDLPLEMVVSYQVGDGSQTKVLWNSSQCSYRTSHPSSPPLIFNSLLSSYWPNCPAFSIPHSSVSEWNLPGFLWIWLTPAGSILCFCLQMSTQTRVCLLCLFFPGGLWGPPPVGQPCGGFLPSRSALRNLQKQSLQ